ncbi:competence protein CoiA [Oceanobacillus rekensis]|uniref:competence protein CoiA n=1 Tax=Oceanobacillus rekensis TaxID=937927 RepID=UPI000B44E52B|nr:competence protein CoiA family protein [Oceanobacillus rekensis]
MLQAINKNGTYTTLATMEREAIIKLRIGGEKFYCPVCESPVIIKAGNQMIAHFAHKTSTNCPSREGGEGIYHEQGKLILYQWLMRHNIDVRLEAYIQEIKQRPDILLTISDKKIAIEYQCARIPVDEIRKRNKGYKAAGIFPIWIIGANQFKRYNATSFKLDQFTRQFIHQYSSDTPQVLYYFDPHTFQMATIYDVFITKSSKAIGKINITSINQMNFTDLFQFTNFSSQEKLNLWVKEKRHFRLKPGNNFYGDEFTWRKWLYYKGTHPQNLPSVIYLPVSSQHQMQTPLWNWQSKLCLEIIHPLPIETTFSIESCKHLLKTRILSNSAFPLIVSSTDPIEQYFNILEQLSYIHTISPGIYQKKKQFDFYKNVEEAINGDNNLLQQLFFQNLGKIQA